MLGLFTVSYAVVQLYRETIIDQALELLDAYGLADMTMRRVASSLGVAAGALYWHIANKQELITAVAHKIITPVFALADGLAITAESEPAQQPPSPQEFCTTLHATLLAHRDGAELVHAAAAQPNSPLWSQLHDSLSATITHELNLAGLAPGKAQTTADIAATTSSALHLVFGASIMEQSAQQFLEATQPATKPTRPGTARSTNLPGTDDVERGITVLLAGLHARLHDQEGT